MPDLAAPRVWLAIAWTLFQLYTAHQGSFDLLVQLPVHVAFAVALGFLAGGGVRRRRHHKGDGAKATKASGLLGLAMSGAMWFVRAKFGSPMGLAHAVLEKIQAAKRSDASSGARRHAATGGAALTSR